MKGPYLFSSKPLLAPASKQFLAHPACKLAQRSREHYSYRWKALQDRYPEQRFNEFTADDIVKFLFTDNDGKKRRPGDPGWLEATVLMYGHAFKSIFRWGKKYGLLKVDPTIDLDDVLPDRRNHKRHLWLKERQIEQLFSSLTGEHIVDMRDRVLIQFLIGTGVRRFECAGSQWGHLDDEAPQPMLWVPDGKGNKPREVTPTSKTIETLRVWRSTIEQAQGAPVKSNQPIIPRAWHHLRDGVTSERVLDFTTALGDGGIEGAVIRVGKTAGFPALRPHDLRRSHAGILDDAGVAVQDIARQLGHSRVDTTIKYLENNPSRRANVMANIRV